MIKVSYTNKPDLNVKGSPNSRFYKESLPRSL